MRTCRHCPAPLRSCNRSGLCRRCLRLHTRQVHRLVLEAFVGPKLPGTEACHYPDPDKANNRLANLRWDTHGENAKDQYRDRGPVTEKRCRRCGETKPVSEFYGDKRSTDGRVARCRSCCARSSAERLRNNPKASARRRAYNRVYMRQWKVKKKRGWEVKPLKAPFPFFWRKEQNRPAGMGADRRL